MKNRPERIIFFLVVWLTMFSFLKGWGQKPYPKGSGKDFSHLILPGSNIQEMTRHTGYTGGFDLVYGSVFGSTLNGRPNEINPVKIYALSPPAAIFCKIEWEMEKATHIPLRFRLGSLADCNAMEGKR